MFENTRLNEVRLYVGKNSVGKTPTAVSHAIAYQKARPNNLVIVFDAQDKFRDAHNEGRLRVDIFIDRNDKFWAKRLGTHTIDKNGKKDFLFKNSLIILDDYRDLCKNDTTSPDFYSLLAWRPYMNSDYKLICHEPRQILRGVAGFITHFEIFANEATQTDFEDRITCFVPCQKSALSINKYVNEFGRGYFDLKTMKPYFPYIEVERDNPYPLRCVNIDINKLNEVLKPTG